MEFHMINIIYAALSIRAQTEKTTFSCKDDCTMTRNTRCWTYSARDFEIPLCHIPPLRSFLKTVEVQKFVFARKYYCNYDSSQMVHNFYYSNLLTLLNPCAKRVYKTYSKTGINTWLQNAFKSGYQIYLEMKMQSWTFCI